MNSKQKYLLKALNNIVKNAVELMDDILNGDTEVKDKDITDVEEANRLLMDLEILQELPF